MNAIGKVIGGSRKVKQWTASTIILVIGIPAWAYFTEVDADTAFWAWVGYLTGAPTLYGIQNVAQKFAKPQPDTVKADTTDDDTDGDNQFA